MEKTKVASGRITRIALVDDNSADSESPRSIIFRLIDGSNYLRPDILDFAVAPSQKLVDKLSGYMQGRIEVEVGYIEGHYARVEQTDYLITWPTAIVRKHAARDRYLVLL